MAKPPRRQDDAVVRVAIFGTTDAIASLCDRVQIMRKQGIEPNWELLVTALDFCCSAWQSNVTAVEALGVIEQKEMENIISRMNSRSMALKDILEEIKRNGR